MNWLGTQTALFDIALNTIEFALNWLLQSSLLIVVGLVIGKLFSQWGSAIQSAVYRTTMVAVLICPIATLCLSQTGVTGWSVELPGNWGQQQATNEAVETGRPTHAIVAENTAPTPISSTTEISDNTIKNSTVKLAADHLTPSTPSVQQAIETSAIVPELTAERAIESIAIRLCLKTKYQHRS